MLGVINNLAYRFLPLAQAWDDTARSPSPAARPAERPMSFSDLQQGLRAYNNGETNDNTMRNGILVLMALVGLVALVIHLRQRHKSAEPPDSLRQMGWSLSRVVRFPMGSRVMLWWVARANGLPFASLMLSSALFDRCVTAWASAPTFSALRRWGQGRLMRLRPVLFT